MGSGIRETAVASQNSLFRPVFSVPGNFAHRIPENKKTGLFQTKERMKSVSYRRGRRDMRKLIEQGFSHTFLVQFTFAMGHCRKDRKRSEKSCYNYCDGWNDRLDEFLESKRLERVDMTKWWKIMRGESKKKIVKKKQKETKTFRQGKF